MQTRRVAKIGKRIGKNPAIFWQFFGKFVVTATPRCR